MHAGIQHSRCRGLRAGRVALAFILLLGCAAAQGQPPRTVNPQAGDDDKPHRCASRHAIIDGVHQNAPRDEVINVIARPGDGDVRPELGRRRLHNVRAYLTEFLSEEYRRKPETIVLMEGERVAGLGRLEFYAGGKLVGMIKVVRNSDVDFGNCYPPDDSYIRNGVYNPCRVKSHQIYYPCRDRPTRRGKRQR